MYSATEEKPNMTIKSGVVVTARVLCSLCQYAEDEMTIKHIVLHGETCRC